MTIEQLGAKLRDAYERAGDREKVVMIHLFAITHANDMRGMSPADVVAAAGIKATYATEVRKGINLARYVRPV